ncbi:MAG: hypothetical protein P8M25_10690 [Paracoccaceae bacterium]|nr:hypothetical protein [Paracoccaceae bacterium]
MLQKVLGRSQLSTAGASFSRFCYSAPILWIGVLGYFWSNDLPVPILSGLFWFHASLGGLAQIFATVCVVASFRSHNFAFGINFKKTEVIQRAEK